MSLPATYQDLFNKHKICVLIPTFNNNGTLQQVLDGVLAYTHNVIVVNDGSTDSTAEYSSRHIPNIVKLEYTPNSGKVGLCERD